MADTRSKNWGWHNTTSNYTIPYHTIPLLLISCFVMTGIGSGFGGRSIVSALERTMSRSTYGGGGGGGGSYKLGEKHRDGPVTRGKKRSEELFGTLMGEDSQNSRGGGGGAWGWGGRGAEGKEVGKNEVDLGFLHR